MLWPVQVLELGNYHTLILGSKETKHTYHMHTTYSIKRCWYWWRILLGTSFLLQINEICELVFNYCLVMKLFLHETLHYSTNLHYARSPDYDLQVIIRVTVFVIRAILQDLLNNSIRMCVLEVLCRAFVRTQNKKHTARCVHINVYHNNSKMCAYKCLP